MMYRLFVAIELPDTVRDQLTWLRADIPGATWTKPAAMHLTLRFLGDGLSGEQLSAIQQALEGIRGARFELQVRGVGRFGMRVLWVGLKAPPALLTLQRQVESAVESVGFPLERDFSPHITLARLRQPKAAAEVQRFLAAHADFQTESFPADQFVLFSSQLTAQGPIYTPQDIYPLNR